MAGKGTVQQYTKAGENLLSPNVIYLHYISKLQYFNCNQLCYKRFTSYCMYKMNAYLNLLIPYVFLYCTINCSFFVHFFYKTR